MKHFQMTDVKPHGAIPNAGTLNYNATSDLLSCPLQWQVQGLSRTASGYGAKIASQYKILFERQLRRVYVTCYGNASSSWFMVKGKKIFLN